MIIEIPDDNSIVKWRYKDNEDWKSAEISDLIKAYERLRGEWKHEVIGDKSCVLCNQCFLHFDCESNFCPNCGADMRGKNGTE